VATIAAMYKIARIRPGSLLHNVARLFIFAMPRACVQQQKPPFGLLFQSLD
jgi:hypothetical protein